MRHLCSVLVVLIGLTVQASQAAHRPALSWMAGFSGRADASCCGELDCLPETVALLAEEAGERVVLIGQEVVTLPTSWVHPSQDPQGQGWVCFLPSEVRTDADGHLRAVPLLHWTRERLRCVFYSVLN